MQSLDTLMDRIVNEFARDGVTKNNVALQYFDNNFNDWVDVVIMVL